ncbi:hypothetical protein RUND412_006587 [Rhizina undulata]
MHFSRFYFFLGLSFANSAAASSEPVTNERAITSPSPTQADNLCSSAAFKQSYKNWWNSNTTEWLKEHTLGTHNANRYRYLDQGLLDSVVEIYLGPDSRVDNGFDFECAEIVRKVEGAERARNVFFLMKSVANAERIFRVTSAGLRKAKSPLEELIAGHSMTAKYWKSLHPTTKAAFIHYAAADAAETGLRAGSAWTPITVIAEEIAKEMAMLKHKYQRSLHPSEVGLLKRNRVFDVPGFSGYSVGYGYVTTNTPGSGSVRKPRRSRKALMAAPTNSRFANELKELLRVQTLIETGEFKHTMRNSKEVFYHLLERNSKAVVDFAMTAVKKPDFGTMWREMVVKGIVEPLEAKFRELLKGTFPGKDGATRLSNFLRYGNYLYAKNSIDLSEWTGDGVAEYGVPLILDCSSRGIVSTSSSMPQQNRRHHENRFLNGL